MDYFNFIKKIISFSPRQLKGETKTLKYLEKILQENNITYSLQKFKLKIPFTKKAELIANNKKIKCENSGFVSGKINNNDVIISSLMSSSICQDISNINYNPRCDGVSIKNNYFAPSWAVSKNDINKVIQAKKINGEIICEAKNHNSANILVGNIKNPKSISFAHYDSILKGAIDNASGVALMMKLILEKQELLKDNLFVFSGAEELSYDKPVYWGRGFRVFEKKYLNLFKLAKKIIIIDCIGYDKTLKIQDPKIVQLGFPILNAKKLANKIKFITADLNKLMKVYHSELDDISNIKIKYLDQAYSLFLKEINKN